MSLFPHLTTHANPSRTQIDESTGSVTGFIDLEGTVLAPTWCAAVVPQWIPDPDSDMASWYGGTPEEQRRLWETYHHTMDRCAPEWREAHEKGEPFREVADRATMGLRVWGNKSADLKRWATEKIQALSDKVSAD